MAGEEGGLGFTPSWIVALVCSAIIVISLFVERLLHYLGKFLKKKNQKPLFNALLKVKEELMLLGFISLLLAVFEGTLQKICISINFLKHMLPCKRKPKILAVIEHFVVVGQRRLLASGDSNSDYCLKKGKFPLLSIRAIHDLHIFIFILATTHVIFTVISMLLGSIKIHQWKNWEESIRRNNTGSALGIAHVHQLEFIRKRFRRFGVDWPILTWVHAFSKQFFRSVTKSDYETMRLGFIMTHCRGNPEFNFHKYMVRALEADFKKVVGISGYLWIFLIVFMLLNVHGWHAYFWLAFVPLIVLLVVGTKLEHVISQLAQEVAEKHSAVAEDLVVNPSNGHFWFHRPHIILFLIHFILFQNAFDFALFFWILTSYGLNSCIMGSTVYIIPRLLIVALVQLLCSYSTLPLYAIVSHMGSSFKESIFDENVREGLVGWAQSAHKLKKKKKKKKKGVGVAMEDIVSEDRNSAPSSVMLHDMVTQQSP